MRFFSRPAVQHRQRQYLQPLDIGHNDYLGLVDPDTAFWALIQKDNLAKPFARTILAAVSRKGR